ncbi:serine/threonine-protein kinase mos [Onthophagus taurus]|uniref:serine/threonine-protein kinase mos n=1 Tax=Onthophagus taurus TaxID=166361 RepID=UPI0039BEB162
MATPIKMILSPKILSPIGNKVNSLLFIPTTQKSLNIPKIICTSPIQDNYSNNTIKIHVTRCKDHKKVLEINTPNKIDLLENGLAGFDFNILGRGSFGTVVKSTYKNKAVAVKIVKLRENKKVLNETFALNLNHKNVIKFHEIINYADKNYGIIIMEYADNFLHLESVINRHELDDLTIYKYSNDICAAIKYCQDNGIVHLDIKPRNILVNTDACVCKLCDFGNCYKMGLKENEFKYVFHGTISYTAPELLLGKSPTFKCDIFSFGVLLWQLMHRDTPYKGVEFELIIYRVVKFNLRPTSFINNQIFQPLYTKCWSTNPDERPTITEIINYLNQKFN